MEERLLSETIQKFIREHEHDDEHELVLRTSALEGVPISLVAQQISGRRKAKEKLPVFFSTPGILYPPSINLEQCSSEATAKEKGELLQENGISTHSVGVDLSGGFGVDSLFLSRIAKTLDVAEPDAELLSLAKNNHQQLGAGNITYHNISAEQFLNTPTGSFDFMYVDPSRRLKGNQKIFRLSDSVPDIISLQNTIHKKAPLLLIKTSPLMDIPLGIRELKFVKMVFVLSVHNECKEVLFLCELNFNGEPSINAIDLKNDVKNLFTFDFAAEKNQNVAHADPLSFIYEPNAAILKAGAFKSVAATFAVNKIQQSTHLYTADHLIENFPGRIFRIVAHVKPDLKVLLEYFPDRKANITTRNYPLSVDELKKKTGLKDGGDKYLIGFSGVNKKFLVAADRLK